MKIQPSKICRRKSSADKEFIALNTNMRKEEMSQIKNLSSYFKNIGKQEQYTSKASRRKENNKASRNHGRTSHDQEGRDQRNMVADQGRSKIVSKSPEAKMHGMIPLQVSEGAWPC